MHALTHYSECLHVYLLIVIYKKRASIKLDKKIKQRNKFLSILSHIKYLKFQFMNTSWFWSELVYYKRAQTIQPLNLGHSYNIT